MAKCKQCNKKGFFLKLDKDGLCPDCIRINKLTQEENRLNLNIANLEKDYISIKNNRDSLYSDIATKPKNET